MGISVWVNYGNDNMRTSLCKKRLPNIAFDNVDGTNCIWLQLVLGGIVEKVGLQCCGENFILHCRLNIEERIFGNLFLQRVVRMLITCHAISREVPLELLFCTNSFWEFEPCFN